MSVTGRRKVLLEVAFAVRRPLEPAVGSGVEVRGLQSVQRRPVGEVDQRVRVTWSKVARAPHRLEVSSHRLLQVTTKVLSVGESTVPTHRRKTVSVSIEDHPIPPHLSRLPITPYSAFRSSQLQNPALLSQTYKNGLVGQEPPQVLPEYLPPAVPHLNGQRRGMGRDNDVIQVPPGAVRLAAARPRKRRYLPRRYCDGL